MRGYADLPCDRSAIPAALSGTIDEGGVGGRQCSHMPVRVDSFIQEPHPASSTQQKAFHMRRVLKPDERWEIIRANECHSEDGQDCTRRKALKLNLCTVWVQREYAPCALHPDMAMVNQGACRSKYPQLPSKVPYDGSVGLILSGPPP